MKFLPFALAAFAISADGLLSNPVKDIKKVQVYVVIVIAVVNIILGHAATADPLPKGR